MPRSINDPYQVSNNGVVKLDSRRQAIQDQYAMQIDERPGRADVVGYVPNVDQTFGGTFATEQAGRRAGTSRPA